MKALKNGFLILALIAVPVVTLGQANPTSTPTEEEQKEKAEKEKKAFALLEQVVEEAQLLRLPENRARVQIGAAEMLWQRDQGRARSLFALAAESIAEMMRQQSTNTGFEDRRGPNQIRPAFQLRQQLVLTAARFDAPLAYQLLAATKPSIPADARNLEAFVTDTNLEDRLLSEIAKLDPKLALQNAELMLDKGEYSRSLAEVLGLLQGKDKEAAAKLEDKMVKRLQSANMLAAPEAGSLALALLRSGPRLETNAAHGAVTSNPRQLLSPSSYGTLLSTVIDAALRVTPQAGSRTPARRTGPLVRAGDGRLSSANEPTAAELEQANARRLLGGLQMLLTQIEQYVPARAQAVRQKLTEMQVGGGSRPGRGQPTIIGAPPGSSAESLMDMATRVPPQVQSRVYQQAAMRALEEGNPDRARQIANDYLEPAARDSVLQAVELRKTTDKLAATTMDEVRQSLAQLRTDDERIDTLLRLSASAVADNRTFAQQLLEEARLYTNRRPTNYQQIDQQLKLAIAFKDLDASRSFEILEPVVLQLNELLTAAATLSGFEISVFKDGELPLEGRSGLTSMVNSYGNVLGQLAESDFDRSQMLANRFQLSEPRLIVRLGIVRGMLGLERGRTNFRNRRTDF